MIITRTPFRITLAGGGTDIPSYYQQNGGLVATMAIDKHVYITLKPDSFEELCKLRYSEIEIVKDLYDLKNERAREALLNHELSAVEINTCADLSHRSGLGSSGSFLVGLLKAIREYRQLDSSAATIAEEACGIEIVDLELPVGKQDQYIAAFGGIRLLKINKSGSVAVESLDIDYSNLIPNMHVYSLDVQRDAATVLADQAKMGDDAKRAMDRIKDIGHAQIIALKESRFDDYGMLLDKHWEEKKKLSNKISLPKVDELYQTAQSEYGVLGGKIIGAGGGGFLMLYVPEKHTELEMFMTTCGLRRLHYTVDNAGSVVLGNHL